MGFFDDNQEQAVEVQKIKLGDVEYSQDELNSLVGLGKIAQEAEQRFNTKIDKLMPEYGKKANEAKKYQEEANKYKQELEQLKSKPSPEQLSQEEIARKAREEAKQLGLLTREEYESMRQREKAEEEQRNAANRLIESTNQTIERMKKDGLPETSVEDLLVFMDENRIGNPEHAYKLKFEKELMQKEMEKVRSLKRGDFYTEGSSRAGSKSPIPTKIDKSNLSAAIAAALTNDGY